MNFKFSFSMFRIRTSGLSPTRINLELWILQTGVKTHGMGDKPCCKAATYTKQ
jgi:hypothetical protein